MEHLAFRPARNSHSFGETSSKLHCHIRGREQKMSLYLLNVYVPVSRAPQSDDFEKTLVQWKIHRFCTVQRQPYLPLYWGVFASLCGGLPVSNKWTKVSELGRIYEPRTVWLSEVYAYRLNNISSGLKWDIKQVDADTANTVGAGYWSRGGCLRNTTNCVKVLSGPEALQMRAYSRGFLHSI